VAAGEEEETGTGEEASGEEKEEEAGTKGKGFADGIALDSWDAVGGA